MHLSQRQANAFERGVLENVLCDAVSFAGYGEAALKILGPRVGLYSLVLGFGVWVPS